MRPSHAAASGRASLAAFDDLGRGAATLDELAWWARTLKAGREQAAA